MQTIPDSFLGEIYAESPEVEGGTELSPKLKLLIDTDCWITEKPQHYTQIADTALDLYIFYQNLVNRDDPQITESNIEEVLKLDLLTETYNSIKPKVQPDNNIQNPEAAALIDKKIQDLAIKEDVKFIANLSATIAIWGAIAPRFKDILQRKYPEIQALFYDAESNDLRFFSLLEKIQNKLKTMQDGYY